MAEQRSTMIDPPIEQLLDTVDSKFTLVTLASKRGRQINSYFNQLGEGLGAIVPPQVASVARKPLSIALEEIAAGKVQAGEPRQPGEEPIDDAEANEPFGAVGADLSELPPSAPIAELLLAADLSDETAAREAAEVVALGADESPEAGADESPEAGADESPEAGAEVEPAEALGEGTDGD
ncbi:MAG TPA: DNA-directed RNA polymerase subunit omega [Acidimicrobiales bacterium]|nr:DNA-directed RNA polymerase subunit omega [Acidimicrobiales bacterium]